MVNLWSWGANQNGQLCHGFASEQISRPVRVKCPKITSLFESTSSCTDFMSSSIKIDGGGTQTIISIDKKVAAGEQKDTNSILISVGTTKNNNNHNDNSDKSTEAKEKEYDLCVIRDDLRITQISCGWDFNLILTQQHAIYSWGGDNKFGQLGRITSTSSESNAVSMDKIPEFQAIKISAGLRHAAAIGIDGQLYLWGDNTKNLLGVNNHLDKIIWKPTKAQLLLDNFNEGNNEKKEEESNIKFLDVQCGKSFTIALDEEGRFWGCGCNKFGQLNLENCKSVSTFTKLPIKLSLSSEELLLSTSRVKEFKCGWSHVLVLLEDGKLFAWGRNNFCQLGNRSFKYGDKSVCDFVENVPEKIISICCGSEHNLVLGESGLVYSWGWNEHENCGVESTTTTFSHFVKDDIKTTTNDEKDEHVLDFVSSPTLVQFPRDENESENNYCHKIVVISCGAGNCLVVST